MINMEAINLSALQKFVTTLTPSQGLKDAIARLSERLTYAAPDFDPSRCRIDLVELPEPAFDMDEINRSRGGSLLILGRD